ncbi:Uncharacterised protein [uncultured archaeon]|nr:Uncharacterised protein [uncultured archaeon]
MILKQIFIIENFLHQIMKYKVSCYNGGPFFKFDWVFVKPDDVIVDVEANSEAEALVEARKRVVRNYYKVIRINE